MYINILSKISGSWLFMFLQLQHNRNQKNEAQLWQSLIEGNRAALDALFRSYYAPLLNYGMRLVSNRSQAKDAIQKLFLKLWKQRESLSVAKSVKSYLFISLRRILLDDLKRQQARDERNQSYVDSTFRKPFNIEEDIIAGEKRSQQKEMLTRAIQKLSPRQKEALYLRFYDGLRNKEVADVMGISHQSIRNHISEAIKNIKRHLPEAFNYHSFPGYKRAESM